jgi:predicted nucleic acid-binding protein
LRKEEEAAIQPNGAEAVWQKADADAEAGRLIVIEMEKNLGTELERVMTACYRNSPSLAIRTLDAIHLAIARIAGETEIVATDKRLREAAALLGFTLYPP